MLKWWLMLQQDNPEDFVIATGKQHSVRDFVNLAAQEVGMKLFWEGEGQEEIAKNEEGKIVISVDPNYYRPNEVETLGDPAKRKKT